MGGRISHRRFSQDHRKNKKGADSRAFAGIMKKIEKGIVLYYIL
jgi:hypothetical protein